MNNLSPPRAGFFITFDPQRGRSALVALVLSLPLLGGFFFCGVNYFTKHLHRIQTFCNLAPSNKPKAT